MNILINLIPIKKGGGQQVAINFLSNLENMKQMDLHPIICCTKNTEVYKFLTKHQFTYYAINASMADRLKFNFTIYDSILKKHNLKLVYTLFGPGLPKRSGVMSIVGCAYSNIFFPEIDFWREWPRSKRIYARIIDRYRLKQTLMADAIIFENKSMLKRANSLFGFPLKRMTFIKPSLSLHFSRNAPVNPDTLLQLKDLPNKKHILLLSGWHYNKNIQGLPSIASELKAMGCRDVDFIVTISPEHPKAKIIKAEAINEGVGEYIHFVGSFAPYDLIGLYRTSWAVILLSLLESFSNNIIEAWEMQRPLIVSDMEWARNICNEAAIYVDRNNPKNIAEEILKLLGDDVRYNEVVRNGNRELETYPSPIKKLDLQLSFIKKLVDEKGN